MGNWKVWANGLLRAAIGGGVNAALLMNIAPETFNFQHPGKLWEMMGAGAFLAVLHFLQQSPLPQAKGGA